MVSCTYRYTWPGPEKNLIRPEQAAPAYGRGPGDTAERADAETDTVSPGVGTPSGQQIAGLTASRARLLWMSAAAALWG
ncbi:hypothetical protein GCM10020256_16000 [Streptomyces thermocoprophilus]